MERKKQLIGAHISIAGGLYKAYERAAQIGINTMQIFTKSNRQWSSKELSEEEIEKFKTAAKNYGISPVVSHASYLINIGSPNPQLRQKSSEALAIELKRCEALEIPYLVLHPGSHSTGTIQECITAIAQELNKIFQENPGNSMILLENTAGQGTNIGNRFEQLHEILNKIENKKRIGICFDTCHAYAAGYNFTTEKSYNAIWTEFGSIIGMKNLKVIHLNDSKKECGSRVDRHEHLTRGKLGTEAFRLLINDKRLSEIPKILETPKDGGPDENQDYVDNIKRIEDLLV